jgi:hypothetical protein
LHPSPLFHPRKCGQFIKHKQQRCAPDGQGNKQANKVLVQKNVDKVTNNKQCCAPDNVDKATTKQTNNVLSPKTVDKARY